MYFLSEMCISIQSINLCNNLRTNVKNIIKINKSSIYDPSMTSQVEQNNEFYKST